jgi:hypothetical protein
MATGGLYGSTSTGTVAPQSGSESVGLYGNNTVFGGSYFEYLIFLDSATTPATPTGGSWSFVTNTGTPPTGWSNTPPATPINKVWISIALVNSKSTATLTWSIPGQFAVPTGNGTVTNVSALTLGTTGTDVSSTVANSTTTPVITLNLPTASATNRGALSAADWTTFNSKGSGTVTSVTGTSPVVSSGGATPAISMAAATASTNGYLTSTDWSTFNSKGSGSVTSVAATVPSFLAVTGSPITASGTLALAYSGTALPVANGGTGVTTSSGANSVVLRDANANITANCLFEGFTSQAASGTTIVLTAASVQNYQITGSGGQVIRLPNATTLPNGALFTFNNNQSSGTITVQNNSSTTIATINSGGYVTVSLLDNTTAAGSWDRHDSTPANVSWSTNTLDYPGSITSATWNGVAVAVNRGGTGQTTQAAAITALAGTQASGQYLRSNGTNTLLSAIQAADVPTLNQNTTGTAANITATSNSTLTTLSGLSLPYSQLSGTVPTWNQNTTGNAATATSATTAITATNIAGGANFQIPYNTASGATSFISVPTISGTYLQYNGTGFSWASAAGLGTVTSVAASVPSFLSISGSPITTAGTLAIGYSGAALPVANGGTGLTTTPANGQLDIGNGTGFTRSTLTAGSNVTITNSAGGITIAATGGGSPGGSTTQVQYNSAGSFAGSANMTFDGTSLTLANGASIQGLTVGRGAGAIASNTAVGASVLNANTTGTDSVGVGSSALTLNTTGSFSAAFGANALASNTAGNSNNAFGSRALISNTVGNANVAMGRDALQSNTSATGNTGIGRLALSTATVGSNNTGLGRNAGANLQTTTIAATALVNGTSYQIVTMGTTTSAQWIASGAVTGTVGETFTANATPCLGTGTVATSSDVAALCQANTLIGYNSGSAMTTGSNNVILGGYTGSAAPISSTGSNFIVLSDGAGNVRGYFDNNGNFLIGTTTSPAGSKELVLGGDYIEGVVAIGNSGTAQTLSLANGTLQTVTMTGNCTFTMPTAIAGKSFILILSTGAGSFTGTFTGVKWPNNTAPTITATASRWDIFTFVSNGAAWYGTSAQAYA